MTSKLAVATQPNGRLAVFDLAEAHFVAINLTVDKAIESLATDLGTTPAIDAVMEAADDTCLDGVNMPTDGYHRWRVCLETLRCIHGDTEADEVAQFANASGDEGTC